MRGAKACTKDGLIGVVSNHSRQQTTNRQQQARSRPTLALVDTRRVRRGRYDRRSVSTRLIPAATPVIFLDAVSRKRHKSQTILLRSDWAEKFYRSVNIAALRPRSASLAEIVFLASYAHTK